MYVHTCDWCGRKSTEGAIHNILVGTDSAMKKSLCSEKCASEVLEKYGAPTPEAEKEWVDYKNKAIEKEKLAEIDLRKKEDKIEKIISFVKQNGTFFDKHRLYQLLFMRWLAKSLGDYDIEKWLIYMNGFTKRYPEIENNNQD